MKRILIAGANSYIGTSFEKYVAQWPDRYHVDTVDMMGEGWRSFSFAGYDAVFHVAGIAHSDTGRIGEEQAALYYRVNTDLAVETAKKAKAEGVRQFIFMSSIIVYGDSAPVGQRKLITRDTLPRPANAYGDSKLRAEQALTLLPDVRFRVALLRPPMIYGKGCKGNYPTLSKLAQRLPVFPDVDNQRSILYIENLCAFVRYLVDEGVGGLFFPQNDEYANTAWLMQCIARAHGKTIRLMRGLQGLIRLLGKRGGMVNRAFGSLAIDRELTPSVCPFIPLEESIHRTEKESP